MRDIILYRWNDGSFVELIPGREEDVDAYFWYVEGQARTRNDKPVTLTLKGRIVSSRPQMAIDGASLGDNIRGVKSAMSVYPLIKRRLFGFLIDAGVSPVRDGHLLQSQGDYDLRLPAFVSDEQWSQRYQIAKDSYVSDKFRFDDLLDRPKYLGRARNLQICHPHPGDFATAWTVRWSDRASKSAPLPGVGAKTTFSADSLEAAIDLVIEKNLILPESKREEWGRENVEHGVFILPTPEEVEVFRILDEPLPFFLPWKQAEEWLRGQS